MLLIVNSNDAANLKKLSNLTWAYIGSYKGAEKTKNVLKESTRKFIAKDIEEITDSVRDNFVDYVGKLSRQQNDKILWYSSRMASKSVTQTSMFHQYVYQKLLWKLSEREADILVVTDNDELIENIKKIKFEKVRVLSTFIFYRKQVFEKIKGYLRILRYFLLWLIYKFFKNKKLKEFNVFIHSWIDARTFRNLPRFTDSYFADLDSFLAERGYRIGRIVSLTLRLKYIFRLSRYFTNIIHPLSYLSFRDLLKSIFTRFTVTLNKGNSADIKDLTILNVLAEHEVSKENVSKAYLYYMLLYRSYQNLKDMIDRTSSFIYPSENQPWEKMLNLAFAGFNRIAYQHSTIPPNWLDYRISQYEKGVPLPQIILTTGKKRSDFLKEHYNSVAIKEAGAIRFSYLFKNKAKKSVDGRPGNIVVALHLSPAISLPLQKQLSDSLKRNSRAGYIIKIKPHPYLPKYAYLRSAFAGYKNCEFVKDNISELLRNCALLITSSATVALESVLSGIKTLYFIPEELSFGLEYFIKDYLFIAYEENFAEKLEEALRSSDYPNMDIEEYFSRPNYSIFLEHLSTNVI